MFYSNVCILMYSIAVHPNRVSMSDWIMYQYGACIILTCKDYFVLMGLEISFHKYLNDEIGPQMLHCDKPTQDHS